MIHQKGSRFVRNDLYEAQLISESSELVPDRSFFYFIIAADLFLLFFHWKKKKKKWRRQHSGKWKGMTNSDFLTFATLESPC